MRRLISAGFKLIAIALAAAVLCAPAQAAPESPVASKDNATYTLEDMSIYFLRMMGKDGLLDFLQSMTVYQEGLKQGLKPTDAEVSEFVQTTMGQDVYAQFKLLFSEKAVRQLIDYTIVNAKYEQWLRKKMRSENKITVTEKEANDYFTENQDFFHLPAGVKISIISVDNKTQAETVKSRLAAGENFNDIAAEVNMDPKMREARGEIGTYRKGDGLPTPLEDAAFKLKEGKYSEIIKGQNYHIIFCHKIEPEVTQTFDKVRDALMADMAEAKVDPLYTQAMDDLMARELEKYSILADLFRPESQPAAARPSGQPAQTTAIASKDGVTYTLEDLCIYFLRMMGKDGLLDYLQSMAVYQEGLKQGLKPADADVTDFVQKTMGPEVYAQFKQLFSERAVRQLIEYTVVNSKYEEWLRKNIRTDNKITVTEKEANDYFLSHINEFHLPAGVYISIISVENKTQAEAVKARLAAGENFNDVAGEVNMDPKMRAARGEIGTYRKGDGLPQPLEDAAFKLREAQASEIIKGQNFHIIFCHKVIPEVSPEFDEVKEQLQQDMIEAKIDPVYMKAMDDLMARELPRFKIQAELFKPDEQGAAPTKPAASKPAAENKPAASKTPPAKQKGATKPN